MYNYNLTRDKFDERDFELELESTINSIDLPSKTDLRSLCPPVFDQGQEGSCTANAGVAARIMLLNNTSVNLSRAFLYYEERKLENSVTRDSGANLRDCCKALQSYGVCEESYMPYLATSISTAPTPKALQNGLKYKIQSYTRLQTLNDIKTSLAINKKPVIIGMLVYSSMESDTVSKTGKLPMPSMIEAQLGGHAVLVVGYIDNLTSTSAGSLIIRNSWGDKGYFYMPYEYFDNYTFDYWVIN